MLPAALSLLALLLAAGEPQPPSLADGISRIEEGDFQAAVEALDPLVRVLAADPARRRELVAAYLHLGIAYVMLREDEPGKGYFREAIRLDPELRLASDRYPARVVRSFEAARAEIVPRATNPPRPAAPAPPPSATPTAAPTPRPSPTPTVAPTPPPAPRAGEVRRSEREGLEYVWLLPGAFEMGCVPGDARCGIGESPRHPVALTRGRWIGRSEVTVSAYKRFAIATGRSLPDPPESSPSRASETQTTEGGEAKPGPAPGGDKDGHPIVHVDWFDAAGYCAWVGGRLPTEAEWEHAARAGHGDWIYVWGTQDMPFLNGRAVANVADESARRSGRSGIGSGFERLDDGYPQTSPAAAYPANDFGLFDMAGNVWEWCADWYAQSYYGESPEHDPPGPARGSHRVLRGGSWAAYPDALRVSHRFGGIDGGGAKDIGFRCVRDTAP